MTQLPAYIGGFRSGTTLLVNLIGQHPDLVPWFETKEFCELLRWLRVLAMPAEAGFESAYCVPGEPTGFSLDSVYARMLWHLEDTQARQDGARASGKASHERYPIGHDHVRYSLAQAKTLLEQWRSSCAGNSSAAAITRASARLIAALAQAQCVGRAQQYWINKTPEITRFAPQLRELHGPVRIIYMVRNGLEVVASASKLGWGKPRELAYNWQGLLTRTRQGMLGHEEHYLELRYEQLLEAPAFELDRVFRFLQVTPCGEAIVQDFRQHYGKAAFRAGRTDPADLPAATLQQFMEVAGTMQAALGYPMPVI